MENLKYIFGQVNDWVKNADQKAMILGSFNIAGFVYQLIKIENWKCWSTTTMVFFILSLTATGAALIYWLSVIYPRLDNKHKKSKIFFQHIANAYGEDIDKGMQELQEINESEFKKDLACQIIHNAVIAKKKYSSIQKFIWAFGIQLIFLIIFLITLYR